MNELVEFLGARLDEDEQAAQACPFANWETSGPPPGHYAHSSTSTSLNGRYEHDSRRAAILANPTFHAQGSLAHAARHDPARVLREVEAKRKLVHVHGQSHECLALTGSGERSVVDDKPWELWEPAHTDDHGPCFVLRCLALPYADHPDYHEEWRL